MPVSEAFYPCLSRALLCHHATQFEYFQQKIHWNVRDYLITDFMFPPSNKGLIVDTSSSISLPSLVLQYKEESSVLYITKVSHIALLSRHCEA